MEERKELEELFDAMSESEQIQVGGDPVIDYCSADLETIKKHIIQGMADLKWGLEDIEKIEVACKNRQDIKDMIAYFKKMFSA